MANSTFITAHAITTYPYSALNTDDTGRPKTNEQGGTTRGRISAYCLKHNLRKAFNDEGNMTFHTRSPEQYIIDELVRRGLGEKKAEKLAKDAIKTIVSKKGEDDKKAVMASYSEKQLKGLCDLLVDEKTSKEDLVAAIKAHKSVDQICFGRMFAGNKELDIEGAVNVGHAFTTHKVMIETDYFTAVDDLNDAGSGHLGRRDGISGTFYRYMSINLSSLCDSLKEEGYDVETTVRDILSSFAYVQPSGGCHNHDNESLPAYIEFDIRTDRPFSYSAAFDSAVQDEDGFEQASIARLEEYADKADKSFGAPAKRFVFKFGETNLEEMLDEVSKSVVSMTSKGEE